LREILEILCLFTFLFPDPPFCILTIFVFQILTKADSLREKKLTTNYAQTELDQALQREIASLWQSDEVSRSKPSPQNEAERGTLVVETVLWEALPSYLRKLNATMESTIGKSLPLTAAPLVFSSWMGGDRDGNPNVTPETTRIVCLKQRAQAAGLLARDLTRLARELSIVECSKDFRVAVGDETREPYRALLRPVSLQRKQFGLFDADVAGGN
jgi:phosphoenolpyruvate carboxylase